MAGMTAPAPNTSILDGVRGYYDQFVKLSIAENPTADWMPAFDALTAEQARAWMLAYASNIELSVRIADALISIGGDVPQ